MSLDNRLTELSVRIAEEINKSNAARGSLVNLQTTNKNSVVAAVNELAAAVQNASGIDDTQASSAKTYSSEKITALIQQTVTDLVDGAPEALNTLQEIAAELQGQASTANDLLTQIGNRVRVDATQTLTSTQAAQARANIGALSAAAVGDTDLNLVDIFNAALAGS